MTVAHHSRVVVVGQGYVGLPLAVRAVEVGHTVVGFDLDKDRVDRLRRADSFIDDITDDDLRASHVAFEIAVDLQDASADDLEALAGDPKVIADDRFSCLDGPRTAELRWSNGTGVERPERYGRS